MLPAKRRERIQQMVQEQRHVKVSDLSRALKVSEMTIYRDLKPLLEEGKIIKVHGGVIWAEESVSSLPANECVLCGSQTDVRLAYRLLLPNQQMETACCPHCGLIRHRQLQERVVQAMCQDFFTQTTIPAAQAWYVLGTEVDLRCCQPQVLVFERRDHADKFVRGFGGKVLPFAAAMDAIHHQMEQGADGSCAKS